MPEGEQPLHINVSEQTNIPVMVGGAREFRGELIEGDRADELNKATEYAFSLGDLDEDSKRTMDHAAAIAWLGANDMRSGNATRIIYDAGDPQQIIQGHITLVTDFDVAIRAKRVSELASAHGIPTTESTLMVEVNFDAPWHEGDAYVGLAKPAITETLRELFETNPEACAYMYVENDDYYPDGIILKGIGAKRVGKDTYLNEPQSRSERWKDYVYVVDRAAFEAAVQ